MMPKHCVVAPGVSSWVVRTLPASSLQEALMRRFARVHFSFISRIAVTILVFAGLIGLAGCWVFSIYPLYEENLAKPDPDLIFDPTLVGSWLATDKDCQWVLTISDWKQVFYELTMDFPPQCGEGTNSK